MFRFLSSSRIREAEGSEESTQQRVKDYFES